MQRRLKRDGQKETGSLKLRKTAAGSDGMTCMGAELTLECRATDFSRRCSSATLGIGTNVFFNILYFLPGFSQGLRCLHLPQPVLMPLKLCQFLNLNMLKSKNRIAWFKENNFLYISTPVLQQSFPKYGSRTREFLFQ